MRQYESIMLTIVADRVASHRNCLILSETAYGMSDGNGGFMQTAYRYKPVHRSGGQTDGKTAEHLCING